MSNGEPAPRRSEPMPLRLLDRMLGWSASALNFLGTAQIFFLLIIINADIFGRFLLDHPVTGVTEMVIVATTGIVYLQLAHALRSGRLVRVDGLLNLLKARVPRVGACLDGVYNLAGAVVFAALAYYVTPFLERTFQNGDVYGNPMVFGVPKWPTRLILVIGASVVVLQFLLLAFRCFSAAFTPERGPDRTEEMA